MQFDIHIECPNCDGFGSLEEVHASVDLNGTVPVYTDYYCAQCEGAGLIYAGRETHESLADVKADYPESFVKNIETGKWS